MAFAAHQAAALLPERGRASRRRGRAKAERSRRAARRRRWAWTCGELMPWFQHGASPELPGDQRADDGKSHLLRHRAARSNDRDSRHARCDADAVGRQAGRVRLRAAVRCRARRGVDARHATRRSISRIVNGAEKPVKARAGQALQRARAADRRRVLVRERTPHPRRGLDDLLAAHLAFARAGDADAPRGQERARRCRCGRRAGKTRRSRFKPAESARAVQAHGARAGRPQPRDHAPTSERTRPSSR